MPVLIRASHPISSTREASVMLWRVEQSEQVALGEEAGRLLIIRGECDIKDGANEKNDITVLPWNVDEQVGWQQIIKFLQDHDLEGWDFAMTDEAKAIIMKGSKPGAHGWTKLQSSVAI